MTAFPDEPMFDYGPGESRPLENNPYFLCLGYRYDEYFFRRKSSDRSERWASTKTFSTAFILRLAPLEFWEERSGTKGKRFPQIKIMDALMQLSLRTGRFVYPYERWLAAEAAAR
jgi:hypothetical protein